MIDTPIRIQKKQLEIFLLKDQKQRVKLGMEMVELGYQTVKERISLEISDDSNNIIISEVFKQLYQNDFIASDIKTIAAAIKKYHTSKTD